MSIIKSLSVGDGDMYYIKHGSSNFTIIDCCLTDDNRSSIVGEIKSERKGKSITRFISTIRMRITYNNLTISMIR